MDYFKAIGRRLTFVFFLVFVCFGFYSPVSYAQSQPDESQAVASCTANINAISKTGWSNNPCAVGPSASSPPGTTYCAAYRGSTGYAAYSLNNSLSQVVCVAIYGTMPSVSNPCSLAPTLANNWYSSASPILASFTLQLPTTDPSTGLTVDCEYTFQPSGPSTYYPDLQDYQTPGDWQSNGNMDCVSGAGQAPAPVNAVDGCGGGQSSPQVNDQNNNPVSTTPTPQVNAPAASPPPQACGGGSCYDPQTDQYCAVVGGAQVCVPGSEGRTGVGGCSTDSGGAVCAGAPSSPMPPATSVPQPSSEVRSTDQTTQVDPSTGNVTVVSTTVYATGNTTTSSGQQSSDSGPAGGGAQTTGNAPAHASSAGGNGTLTGGTDCNTPPICTGDSVMCGIARVQWSTTCQVHSDLVGPTGQAPASSATVVTADQVWVTPPTDTSVGGEANQGNYDETGGGDTVQCPLTDYHMTSVAGVTVAFSDGCQPLNWLALAGKGFALFAAAMITAGSNR